MNPSDRLQALDEFESKRLFAEWGVPVIEERRVASPDQVPAAARELGFPVALKVCSARIAHKSDSGGVILGIEGPEPLAAAVDALTDRFADLPLLVQRMAPEGVELIIGVRRDPVFGPVVLAGLGGVFAEIFEDSTLELAPVSPEGARAMLERLRGYPLLTGYRGGPELDIDAAARAVAALSELGARDRRVIEAEANPLMVHPHGAVAVDGLARLDPEPGDDEPEPRPDPETLAPFFKPKTIAVIGASRNPSKGGNIIIRNLQRADSRAAVYPINPTGRSILGLESYKTVDELPHPVDLAMIVIPKEQVDAAVDRCARLGVKALILATGGYSDIGEAGRREQEALVARARLSGMRVMGPNSIGTVNPRHGLATSIVGLDPIRPGGVTLFGQTGVFSSGWARWIGDALPFGLARIACIGNKGDVDETDLLEYFAHDRDTKTIGIYMEGVSNGPRFVKAAAEAAARKPVVVLKSGRTEAGAEAIASHTGSLAPADKVFDAVCRRTGLTRAPEPESFFDCLAAFEALPRPGGNRLGVLSITGLGCVLTSDAAAENHIELPALRPETVRRIREVVPHWAPLRNPVDIWSAVEQHGAQKTMGHITRVFLESDYMDAALIIFVLMPESHYDIEAAFGETIRAHPDKPVMVAYFGGTNHEVMHIRRGFAELGVPCFPGPERAIKAFRALADYAQFRKLLGK